MKTLVILPDFLPVEDIEKSAKMIMPDLTIRSDTEFEKDDSEILVATTFTKVDKKLVDKLKNLRFVQIASTGYDNVDLEYLKEKGIMLSNIPVANKESVAEHVISMALSFLKDQKFLDQEIRSGRWPLLTRSFDLMGKTFGIVGMGAIGKRLAERLIPFGVGIVYYDEKRLTEDEEERFGCTYLPFDDLLSSSDIISVHVPLTEKTRKMFNSDAFSRMKEGSIFINTSRGEVVDESALIKAIKDRGIKAGIDVFEREPPDPDSEIFKLDNTIFSPHIAGVTMESQNRFLKETIANVLRFNQGIDPLYRVI